MKERHHHDLLGTFAHHRVAANLLMAMMILAGVVALSKMNVQFFPNFQLDFVTVQVVWSGASAEDIEEGITIPLEQRLKTVDNLRKMTSTSSQGVSLISLEFEEGTNPIQAKDQVQQKVDEFRNLPQDAEDPEVTQVLRYEPIAKLALSGVSDVEELRALVHRFEQELLARGIDKVDVLGLPEEEVAIQVSSETLDRLGLSLDQIGDRVDGLSQDVPAGSIGDDDGMRELRSVEQRRDALGFAELTIVSEEQARLDLASIAEVSRQARDGEVTLSMNGVPVVELSLQRAESGNSLEAAQILETWLQETRATLPPTIELMVYDESWQLIKDRIMLLVKNGGGGLLLVVAILYIFLTGRVAFWVAVGIPVSFMATLAILFLAGGSINMISLFALIMALGIIVDDAIVVGEDALAHYQMGEAPLLSAEGGARRMLAPVMASSLTTIAAFLPLMLVGGIIGNILFAIPLVIVSVIIASLIESFLVLPGHLRHSFLHTHKPGSGSLRERLDRGFATFRDKIFRPVVTLALDNRATTLAITLAMMILAVGLLAGGRISFVFFPSPEGQIIQVNATFVSGTPRERVDAFMHELEHSLRETDAALGGGLVQTAVMHHGSTFGSQGRSTTADQLGSIMIEMLPPDRREVRNQQFIKAWRERIQEPAGMESLTIEERRGGPPGKDVSVRLTGENADDLKAAALALQEALKTIEGVGDVTDDMPYGREQLIYSLSPAGEALGLTVADLGRQLRTLFDGRLVQIYQDGSDEVEVKVQLPAHERRSLSSLETVRIRLPSGEFAPLNVVAQWETRRGFEAMRHAEGLRAVEVMADVDTTVNKPNSILAGLKADTLPPLMEQYGIQYSLEGRAADQRETMSDMMTGLLIGLTLIYLVLAWVFSSYGWPFVVMAAIPFGLVGAIVGHWLLGIDLTILSLFGFFGLSGIVVNDSIILVTFYKQLRQQGLAIREALIEASCQRLRAVMLTSLTTIAGLTPLLFETSLQAQFLIPMAASIAFGLMFATFLILLVIPTLLYFYESLRARIPWGEHPTLAQQT